MTNIPVALPPLSSPVSGDAGQTRAVPQLTSSFADYLNQAIRETSDLQHEADQAAVKLATGEIQDVHQVMITAEKASLAMQLTIQIRNKVLESYQEIMRMQI